MQHANITNTVNITKFVYCSDARPDVENENLAMQVWDLSLAAHTPWEAAACAKFYAYVMEKVT